MCSLTGVPDRRTMVTPDRIAIEKLDTTMGASPPATNAYDEALWTYLATPFLLAMEGVRIEAADQAPCRRARPRAPIDRLAIATLDR